MLAVQLHWSRFTLIFICHIKALVRDILVQVDILCSVFRDLSNYRSTAGVIYELLLAKSGLGVISSLCVTDIDFIIDYLRVS